MLRQRVITGLALIGLFLAAILLLEPAHFRWAALLVFGVGAWEWSRLAGVRQPLMRVVFALVFLALGVFVALRASPEARIALIGAGVAWWAVVLVLLAVYHRGVGRRRGWHRLLTVAAFLTLLPAWVAVAGLHAAGWQWILFLVGIVAVADTGAYFTGRAFGKHKLAPELSPGKTREGVLGGLAGVALWAVFGAWWLNLETGIWVYFIGLCLVVALISVAGDLFESLIKREAGAKDSGVILPGHGGILDRIDSLTAAAPVFAIGLYWI
ncbi:MAG TPA: phosphatidate cytidylyltransferase [Thioalkalivibrio sp.]|nr:phosphatidate cytidylyltransferase [Thioalkalivibrio sp.]